MNLEINAKLICNMMEKSLEHVDPNELAYLFATGKNELYLRDHLAAYMDKNIELTGNQFIGREWKKHDLTINDGPNPYAIIEGKSYIHYDAANPTHLEKGKNSIKNDIERDLGKTTQTLRRKLKLGLDCKRIFTAAMFTVAIEPSHDESIGHVTYAKYHRQGGNRFQGYVNLIAEGRKNLERLLSEYGEVSSTTLPCGSYRNMKVTVDFYVVESH